MLCNLRRITMSNMHYAALFQGKFMFSSSRCIATITFRILFYRNMKCLLTKLKLVVVNCVNWNVHLELRNHIYSQGNNFCWFPVIKYLYTIQLLFLQIASLSNYNFNMRYSIFNFPHINPCIVNCNTCVNNFTVSVMIDFILTRLICTSVYCVSSQHPYFWIKISPHRR